MECCGAVLRCYGATVLGATWVIKNRRKKGARWWNSAGPLQFGIFFFSAIFFFSRRHKICCCFRRQISKIGFFGDRLRSKGLPRGRSGLCSYLKGFLRITFVGKLHTFSRFFWFLALDGFSNINFASKRKTGHVCPDPAQESPRCSLFLAKSFFICWRKDTLIAMAEARLEKNDRPEIRKTFFLSQTQRTTPSTGGPWTKQAPPGSGARPSTKLAPQSGTVVGCCAVSCFDLPS